MLPLSAPLNIAATGATTGPSGYNATASATASAGICTEYYDGQPQCPPMVTTAAPVTQLSDGQASYSTSLIQDLTNTFLAGGTHIHSVMSR